MIHDESVNPSDHACEGHNQPADRAERACSGHRLGPIWSMVPLESAVGGRLYAAGVLAAVIAIFGVAAGLHPDGLSHGAHQQLGLPPCGFVVMAGLPCPTCGMTTAFAHTIRGHLVQALHAQVAGLLLALGMLAVGGIAAFALLAGRRPALNWYRINPMHVVWVSCGLFVAAWGVKILLFLLEDGPAGPIRF